MQFENDYESTLGVENDGEPSAVVPADPPVETPVAPEVEADSEGETELDESGQPKKKMGGFQKRIEKLSRKLSEKDAELEYLRKMVPQAPPAAAPVKEKFSNIHTPTADQYDSADEYIAALVKHQVDEGIESFKQSQVKVKAEQTEQEHETKFRARINEAPAKFSDWDDVMEDTTAPSTPIMDQVIKKSDVGIDLMYFLAKNEAEAVRISRLPDPISQAMAMGVLEQQFRTAQKANPPAAKTPGAPPPIKPVTTATTSVAKSISDMDGDEYLEFMRQSKKKR